MKALPIKSCTLTAITLFFTTIILSACTQRSEYLPSEADYNKESALLIKVSDKLANEPDVKKLHGITVGLQLNRTLSCKDFNEECSKFTKFLSNTVELSAKGQLSSDERTQLRNEAEAVRTAVEAGKVKLRKKTRIDLTSEYDQK